MAKKTGMVMMSPLLAPGVGHATVSSPQPGSPPDPLGVLDPHRPELPWLNAGTGDNVNDWTEEAPAPRGQATSTGRH